MLWELQKKYFQQHPIGILDNMRLHENKELFLDSILATSQLLNLPEIYIEKDYWVTVALYEIFHSNMADQTVFNRGTALSKCSKLINRFSED